jgi:hypothetical protein
MSSGYMAVKNMFEVKKYSKVLLSLKLAVQKMSSIKLDDDKMSGIKLAVKNMFEVKK